MTSNRIVLHSEWLIDPSLMVEVTYLNHYGRVDYQILVRQSIFITSDD